MKKSSNKGFTLVELIIVIAILAIIMLIAIPNFSGIQQRMQVRADKSTAAQIGKAVRVWFTDYTTDTNMLSSTKADTDWDAGHKIAPVAQTAGGNAFTALNAVDDSTKKVTPLNYEDLVTIDEYITRGQKPTSLKPSNVSDSAQFYGVFLTKPSTNTAAKIGVAVVGTVTEITVTESGTPAVVQANYDGTAAGVAYVEP